MQLTCSNPWCSQPFEITDGDLKFYEKVSPVYQGRKEMIPPPTLCPVCRQQRRLGHRNEHKLYEAVCGLCKAPMISTYDPRGGYTVYCNTCWWSDQWDPREYGHAFDFHRTFIDQFTDLFHRVPKAAVLQLNNENCTYNHLLAYSKNTYMSPGSFLMKNCFYVRKGQRCQDCINSNVLNKCELVSDSTNCDSCYSSHYLVNCRNCSSSSYLQDCSNLRDCFLCSGLHEKQHCIKNAQYTKEEYSAALLKYERIHPKEIEREFHAFNLTLPKKAQIQLNCEHSSGDYLHSCHNAHYCFDCFDVDDGKHLYECEGVQDSMDLSMHDKDIVLCYEMSSGGESNYQTAFSYCTIASPRSAYLYSCFYQEDSFGCCDLHARSKYSILNKQYSKEEFEELVPKVIAHMGKTGEWGEYFPIALSPYAYNETVAQEYYPLSNEEAVSRGWKWKEVSDVLPQVKKIIPAHKLPQAIGEIPDDILHWAIQCEATGRPYQVIKQELALYRKLKQPIPHYHPDERHRRRMSLHNPRKLWHRKCGKCERAIETTYNPERPEKVYCEECYLKEVY